MALGKQLKDKKTGVIMSYHKILTIEYYGAGVALTVGSYPTLEARENDLQPFINKYFVNEDDFLMKEAYKWLKKIDDFKNAEDV